MVATTHASAGMHLWGLQGPPESLLPVGPLQSLRELEVGSPISRGLPLEFTALGALTKVDIQLGQSHVPQVLLGLASLRDVTVTMHGATSDHLSQLVSTLPGLTRLASVSCMKDGADLVECERILRQEARRVAWWFDTGGRLTMELKVVSASEIQTIAA